MRRPPTSGRTSADQDVAEMELSFSRGFSPGWLGGCDHKMLVPGMSSAKRGVLVGECNGGSRPKRDRCARRPIAAGDGVVFAGDREAGDEQGGRVYEVTPRNGRRHSNSPSVTIRSTLLGLQPGQQLWKTDDPQLSAKLRKYVLGHEAPAASWAECGSACRGG